MQIRCLSDPLSFEAGKSAVLLRLRSGNPRIASLTWPLTDIADSRMTAWQLVVVRNKVSEDRVDVRASLDRTGLPKLLNASINCTRAARNLLSYLTPTAAFPYAVPYS